MVSPKLLLWILVGVAVLGLGMLALQWWIAGGIVTAIALALMYVWWRLNQILQVSDALSKNDVALARTRLESVKNPEKLNAYSKTYYYFFLGLVELQVGNLKPSRAALKTSLEVNRFRSVDERATALFYLAQLDLRSRNTEGARRYLREAKALEPSAQVREQISSLVKQARLRL